MPTNSKITTEYNKKYHYYPDKIIDGLYIGPYTCAQNYNILDNFEIKHIINVTHNHKNKFENFYNYHTISIEDTIKENIYKYFEYYSEFINQTLNNNENILVHCNAGQSRSATIILAFFIKYKKMSLKDSLEVLQSKRKCIAPNVEFIKQLLKWEQEIHNTTSINVDEIIIKYISDIFPNTDKSLFKNILNENNNDLALTVSKIADIVFN